MPFRLIDVPALGRELSNIMAAPSSAAAATHRAGLGAYHALGGNCVHLHCEGGETHSRRDTGAWLRELQSHNSFFVCTQICHDDWDEVAQQPIDRFTPAAVAEDIATDLALIGTEYLDLVYLDDHPGTAFEPLVNALAAAIAQRQIRAWGVRNWSPDRIRGATEYAARKAVPGPAAVVTTELALPIATMPLWPDYLPFDAAMDTVARDLGLVVLAHAGDVTFGQCLWGAEDALARLRPEWVQRWPGRANAGVVQAANEVAATRGVVPRIINLAWVLQQDFPVVAIVGLPSLLTDLATDYEHASSLLLTDGEKHLLGEARVAAMNAGPA